VTPIANQPSPTPLGADDPINKAIDQTLRQRPLFLFGTSLAIGLHLGFIHLWLRQSWVGFFMIIALSQLYAALTLALWRWVMPHLGSQASPHRWLTQTTVAASAFAIFSIICLEIGGMLFGHASFLRSYDGTDLTFTISAAALRIAPIVSALIPIIPASILCVVGYNLHWSRLALLQAHQHDLQELATSAQLAALRAQINPHFLFNSLNSIAQLISTDPEKAEACVERLAELFRYMLTRSQSDMVALDDELEFAHAYLDIERARFGDELVVRDEVDDTTRAMLMPGLILQPLVENAVKHGISQKIGGGEVRIRATMFRGDLHVQVSDTGVGIQTPESVFDRGIGLRNVRDRLVGLYGAEYSPTVTSTLGQGTSVLLRIPVRHTTH
jgi:anti-sigma regulatory factor (Ser/Thr protein kinase)